jgi:predicted nucleic-acid-binding Zn-ribbon protein
MHLGHKCRKCGNENISYDDVLNYSSYGDIKDILDIPDQLTHKHDKRIKK